MTERDGKIIDYMVAIVSEYAEMYDLSGCNAFEQLDAFGGIQALEDNYDIEHTLPVSSTIDALEALRNRMDVVS